MNVGRYCRYMATACRRARTVADRCASGRIGSTEAALSSSASNSLQTRRKARARSRGFKCAVDTWAVTKTRISTSSALGAGRSSGSDGVSDGSDTATTGCRRQDERQMNGYGQLRRVYICPLVNTVGFHTHFWDRPDRREQHRSRLGRITVKPEPQQAQTYQEASL